MKKTFELLFKDEAERTKKITLSQPKAGITEAEAQSTLAAFLATDIFLNDEGLKPYAKAVGARYVTRNVEDIYVAQDEAVA